MVGRLSGKTAIVTGGSGNRRSHRTALPRRLRGESPFLIGHTGSDVKGFRSDVSVADAMNAFYPSTSAGSALCPPQKFDLRSEVVGCSNCGMIMAC